MRQSVILLVVLALCGCASLPPRIPEKLQADPAASARAASMRDTLVAVTSGWGNLGRMRQIIKRAEAKGLLGGIRTEWIDWYTFQRNIIIDLPGRSRDTVYLVAHYDRTDVNPVRFASMLVSGLLDDVIPIPSMSEGALDNGTGVAVVMEVASELARRDHYFSYRILFTGSEESGFRGSRNHVASLTDSEAENIVLALNIDTVGVDTDGSTASICLTSNDYGLSERAQAAGKRKGLDLQCRPMEESSGSDYIPFGKNGFREDFFLGVRANLVGGLLPQRSWFGGGFPIPAINMSTCDLSEPSLFPVSRIHGPADRLDAVSLAGLYDTFIATTDFLRNEEELARARFRRKGAE